MAIPLLGIYPRDLKTCTHKNHKKMYTNIHSSIVHNSRNVETISMSSTDKHRNKILYMHKTEYYSTMKGRKY